MSNTANTVAVVTPTETANTPLVAYSSIKGDDIDAKMDVLNAVSNAEPIAQHLGEELLIRDIIIMNTTLTDKATGEVVEVQRTVVITEDGTAYAAMSGGIIRSLNNMIGVLGEPSTWPAPVATTIVEAGPVGRRYYTAKFGPAKSKKK